VTINTDDITNSIRFTELVVTARGESERLEGVNFATAYSSTFTSGG